MKQFEKKDHTKTIKNKEKWRINKQQCTNDYFDAKKMLLSGTCLLVLKHLLTRE